MDASGRLSAALSLRIFHLCIPTVGAISKSKGCFAVFSKSTIEQFRVFFRKIAYRLYGFLKYLILTILNPSFAHLFFFYRTTPLGDKHCRCDVAGERKETERKVGSLIRDFKVPISGLRLDQRITWKIIFSTRENYVCVYPSLSLFRRNQKRCRV